jgi:hypothetical protein
LSSRSYETAGKRAVKDRKFFIRYGWEEFCQFEGMHEILKSDVEVLKKYLTKIFNKNITASIVCLNGRLCPCFYSVSSSRYFV